MRSQLALVLHAHLPFVRHPEHETFLEELWLFEAIAETYLPLLARMDGWARDGLRWHLTLTLTPTLCAMLRDELLGRRFEHYLATRLELAARERERHLLQPAFGALAGLYERFYKDAQTIWFAHQGDILAGFDRHARAGNLEILASAATHAFLPLLTDHPASVRAQLSVGAESYRRAFGRPPAGIWLPECGFAPALDPHIREAGFTHFVMETHGILHADPLPRRGVMAPILTPGGSAAFGRDPASARQVWSRRGGYPGDLRYREFHRDLIHDADRDYLRSCLATEDLHGFSGFKYHRITSHDPNAEKSPYNHTEAMQVVREHAEHFLKARATHGIAAAGMLDRQPLFVCPYDAELFGHWWFEGVEFLDHVVRGACASGSQLELTTLQRHLELHPANQCAMPAASSWGEGGHGRVWLNPKNAWMQPHLRLMRERMVEVVNHRPVASTAAPPEHRSVRRRVLQQAGRELLLAQSSDWPFLMTAGTASSYARERFVGHLANFNRLLDEAANGAIDLPFLEQIEDRNNLFPWLDPDVWLNEPAADAPA